MEDGTGDCDCSTLRRLADCLPSAPVSSLEDIAQGECDGHKCPVYTRSYTEVLTWWRRYVLPNTVEVVVRGNPIR